jgi:hypothetical protein
MRSDHVAAWWGDFCVLCLASLMPYVPWDGSGRSAMTNSVEWLAWFTASFGRDRNVPARRPAITPKAWRLRARSKPPAPSRRQRRQRPARGASAPRCTLNDPPLA